MPHPRVIAALSHERDNGRIISRRAISRTLSSRYSPDDRNNSNHIPSFTSSFGVTAHDFGIVEYTHGLLLQDPAICRTILFQDARLSHNILRATFFVTFSPVVFLTGPRINFTICLYSVIRKDDNANGSQIANRPSVYIAKRY